jgi:hypothetical protein
VQPGKERTDHQKPENHKKKAKNQGKRRALSRGRVGNKRRTQPPRGTRNQGIAMNGQPCLCGTSRLWQQETKTSIKQKTKYSEQGAEKRVEKDC